MNRTKTNYRMISLLNKLLLAFVLFWQISASAQSMDKEGIPELPDPPRLLNDFAGLLSQEQVSGLEQKLVAYNDSTSTQITIVTVKSIADYSIEDFAVRLGRKWGIGQKDKNNGILITVAREERKVDIEIGYGLEPYVTDYDSKHIIDELILPAFKQGKYYDGLDQACDRLIGLMQGTYTADRGNDQEQSMPWWVILLIILFILIVVFSSRGRGGSGFGRSGGGWIFTGGGGSWGGGGGSGGFSGFGGGSFGGGGSSGSW